MPKRTSNESLHPVIEDPKPGDVRVSRLDWHNFVCELYREVGVEGKDGKPSTKRYEWVVEGYYGSNLRVAIDHSLRLGTWGVGVELLESLKRAEKNLMSCIRQHMEAR